ncbi:hypothetical protein FRC00_003177 [Tulasnella sp. 408]|nr:hypothetical protein FRC00_003177 [Tulasnella sp. 408]
MPFIAESLGYAYIDIGNSKLEARQNVWYLLGEARREARSKFGSAEAPQLTENSGSDLDLANAYWRMEELLVTASAIYESIGSDLGYANSLNGLGDIQRRSTKLGDAHQSFTEAFVVYKGLGNGLGRSDVLAGLGDLHPTQSRLDEAEESYTQALTIYER